jgi:coenzyme F420-reducing hydrogenase alpha subunit
MNRTIAIDYLARVEGESALTIHADGSVELGIFEPPRFFEALLVGRAQREAPDITSRICGICPVAYLMSSCRAIEDALGVTVDGPLRELRRLLYFGEWIESHSLHLFLLALPDFLGHPDALSLAKDHRQLVQRGLRIKRAGNAIVAALGGREIHPINVRLGGFYRVPDAKELAPLLPELTLAREAMRDTIGELGKLTFPDVERDFEFVALQHQQEYAILDGRLVSSGGLDIDAHEYEAWFAEEQVPYSTALRSTLRGRSYLCGPLARFNLGFDKLAPIAREAASAAGVIAPCRNPFKLIVVRAVEVLHALDQAVAIVEHYQKPERAFLEPGARAASGCAFTEAPRGLLYHRYSLDDQGLIPR